MTYLLKEERGNLPPFLRLVGHEGLRFEDFAAQDRSSRQACLAGVDEADVYVLLLGPRYGQRFPDTNLSPTAEEFTRARGRGIPILVFTKITDEPDEPDQAQFKSEVGHYVNGRLWRSFADPVTCNQAVGEALAELKDELGSVRKSSLTEPADVAWLTETEPPPAFYNGAGHMRVFGGGGRGGGLVPSSVYAPVLELHLAPERLEFPLGLRDLAALSEQMAEDVRSTRFVPASDPLNVGADAGLAWAVRPSESRGRGWGKGMNEEQFRGLVANSSGAVGAFVSLPADSMGALVDQSSVQRDLARLFGLAIAHVGDAESVSVAAGLVNADRVWEGDPRGMGARTEGSIRMTQGAAIRVGGDFAVQTRRLINGFGDIGADLAFEMLHDLNTMT